MKVGSLIVAVSAVVFSASLSAQVAPKTMASCLSTEIVEFDGNIVEAAVATPSLSTLVTAVEVAGLVDTLATAEGITVYAPTNAAFDALPGDLVDTLLGNTDLLSAVLTFHVSPMMVDARRFVDGYRRSTLLDGQFVFIDRTQGYSRVNNARVSCQGVQASNGLVWIIDSVLIPAVQ
ncbi:fasciclin domain-containing protein [Candidatus Marimicrobium litorale]|uniref:Fasciclin domain-containing protein n=1 Tax=Candidatus Marimicrobium litorale TaxID=2518991 RepID=A0ABT3T1N0_9GAMM|nr:fasciclin domain-containing protein [Candidatus Marimicrobium litorale]MCX2976167.1 fasciclin domain-containing protein [Candidatus Marimicrobium litorale]